MRFDRLFNISLRKEEEPSNERRQRRGRENIKLNKVKTGENQKRAEIYRKKITRKMNQRNLL